MTYFVETTQNLSKAAKEEIDALILTVWRNESRETFDVEVFELNKGHSQDPLDSRSTHILVRNELSELVGYGRVAVADHFDSLGTSFLELGIKPEETPFGYISRLVVHPKEQRKGIATLIHRTRVDIAKKSGAKIIYGWAVGEKPRHALAHLGFKEIEIRQGFRTNFYQTRRAVRLVKLELRQNAHTSFAWAT